MVLVYIGLLGVFILSLVYYVLQGKFDYWKKQKVQVPGPKPIPFFGNYKNYMLMNKSLPLNIDEICQDFPNDPYIGVYLGHNPTLIVQDPELLKTVLTKDFYYFNGREITEHVHGEPLGKILFFEHGDRWKVLRQNLTPLFTSSKMKNMFYLIDKCAIQFEKLLDQNTDLSNVEVRDLVAKYTIDCIGICAFGVDTNVMGDDKNNPFRKISIEIFEFSYIRAALIIVRAIWPQLFYGLGLKQFPNSIVNFFNSLLSGVFEQRQYKPTSKNDFIDMILNFKVQNHITGDAMSNMKSNEKTKVDIEVNDEFLMAQCFLFFAAGFETSATTSSYALFELAKNQEAQEKAYQETIEYLKKNNYKLNYDCVTDMPYMNACIDEALRLFPVVAAITREVMEDYSLPDGLSLKKGTRVHIPIHTLHHNEKHFPNATKFQPERFLENNGKNIKPYTYMPFGDGPRVCIGMRFARMQTIPGLMTILKKYKLSLADGQSPDPELEPKALVTLPKESIRIKFTPREGWEQRKYTKAN